jgi:hypothetical protein
MNLMLLAASMQGAAAPGGVVGDSCAIFLFVSGAVSMSIAAYLLYKSPQPQPVRLSRR